MCELECSHLISAVCKPQPIFLPKNLISLKSLLVFTWTWKQEDKMSRWNQPLLVFFFLFYSIIHFARASEQVWQSMLFWDFRDALPSRAYPLATRSSHLFKSILKSHLEWSRTSETAVRCNQLSISAGIRVRANATKTLDESSWLAVLATSWWSALYDLNWHHQPVELFLRAADAFYWFFQSNLIDKLDGKDGTKKSVY